MMILPSFCSAMDQTNVLCAVPVEKDAVVGSYRLHSSWFLQKEARPARIDLDKDGELRVYAD
ncbi:MAG: hypothetical protein KBG86_10750, partial [Flavobacteriales bacterium]|nr:hypothetical protein [Flavobacteriales bacterium]